ncbi:MAG: bacteriohemerythrin [Treponema sp.]|jgi:hemerythrin|nr:bacteriohemerythrin [Treponema sp.]
MTRLKGDLVTWSNTFSVGIKLIDDQHKILLNIVNDMFNHVVGDEEAERVYFREIIQKAVNYVKIHFSTEEKIILNTRFSGYAEHKKEHEAFILAIVDKVRDFEAGKRLTLTEFTRFLREWILTHIAIMDKQYFNYFKQIATRKENGKLSITQADVMR